ncbi:hypothetical protein K438DRAFT_1716580 [Mycena galopus ATCC 62051]|nr:hypothetical protein K438DRAFT_1716580 [Mycena galopus ATCC 62051]
MALDGMIAEILTWNKALAACDDGDFGGALRLFEPIADKANIIVNVALIHERLGERALALENFTRAVELDSHLVIAYFQRGVCYFHGGQYAEAVLDFAEAQVRMRGNTEIHCENLGLEYKIKLQEILFNKWLAVEKEKSVQTTIEASPPPELEAMISKTAKNLEEGVPFSLPVGTLFRPPPNKLQMLMSAKQGMAIAHETPTQTPERNPSPYTASSDTSSTFLPSIRSGKGHRKDRSSISSTFKASMSDDSPEPSSGGHVPKRTELNRVIGDDNLPPMNEIHTIPCAGVRISHGPLTGLMAWRFVVRLDGPGPLSVVTNFILDTSSKDTFIPSVALRALGRASPMKPGTEITLRIQNVKTKCIVANSDEVGRIGISFMTAGSLSYYFDQGLVAPVLYDGSGERPANVPRTIRLPSRSWLSKLWSLLFVRG